jgi:hypothetical protein
MDGASIFSLQACNSSRDRQKFPFRGTPTLPKTIRETLSIA